MNNDEEFDVVEVSSSSDDNEENISDEIQEKNIIPIVTLILQQSSRTYEACFLLNRIGVISGLFVMKYTNRWG